MAWPKNHFLHRGEFESSRTVSKDLLEYSERGILFSTYVMAATDKKMLSNLTLTTDFFC